MLIGGAAINRDFGRRALYPHGKESDEVYEPGVFYCKDAFAGLDTVDALVDEAARESLVGKIREEAQRAAREAGGRRRLAAGHRRLGPLGGRDRQPDPEPPFWGAREVDVDLDEVYPYLDRHVLFKLHWGGRGKKGEDWRRIVEGYDGDEGFAPKLERMWREQDYLHPRVRLGYFPCNADGNELVIFDPEDHDREIERLVFPRQPKHDRICLADFYRPLDSGERDVVALQAVTVGARGHRADRASSSATASSPSSCSSHGLGVQAAEGLAEWLHAEVRRGLGIELDQGRRYSWGYPACPDQSEHEKVERLLGMSEIGIELSGGYALEPEQSTAAIIAHHPQAVYFGMKSGLRPRGEEGRRADRRHRPRRRAAARGGPRGRRHDRGGDRRPSRRSHHRVISGTARRRPPTG